MTTRLACLTLLALLLTGCSTFAIYRNPVTGEVMECETAAAASTDHTGRFGSADADCKTTLEERGYKRTGTRYGDYQHLVAASPILPGRRPTVSDFLTQRAPVDCGVVDSTT